MSSDSSKNNSLVVRSSSSKKKIVFNDKEKYDNAVHNQKEIIADTVNEINYIEEELRKLRLLEKELEKEAKANKKTSRAQIPTSQKHTIVPVYEFDNIYNYDERRKSWHKKAGHNNSQVVCDYCKDDDNWETILLDNDKHVCYYCWIKKPDNLKNKKTSIVVKKKPQVDVIDYEEIYPVELDTLRTAFQVLPRPVQKEYEKRIYKMIDCLIDKKFIKKRH